MRIAVFSDLHANRQAWSAVLADMRQENVEAMVCLGDVVGYGPEPQEVLDSVRACTEDIVLGNHDAVIGGRMDSADFNDHARAMIEWTRGQLSGEAAAFCAQLPDSIETENVLYIHAEAADPLRFGYLDTPEEAAESFAARPEALIFIGHTHVPCVFALNLADGGIARRTHHRLHLRPHERHIVNVGSVGDPRDGDPRASYVIFDDLARTVEFRRVPFDVGAYVQDLQARGLDIEPSFLAAYRYRLAHPDEDAAAVVKVLRAQPALRANAQAAAPRAASGEGKRRKVTIRPRAATPTPAAAVQAPTAVPAAARPGRRRKVALLLITALLAGGAGVAWKFFASPSAKAPASAETNAVPAPETAAPAAPTAPAPAPAAAPPQLWAEESFRHATGKTLTNFDAAPVRVTGWAEPWHFGRGYSLAPYSLTYRDSVGTPLDVLPGALAFQRAGADYQPAARKHRVLAARQAEAGDLDVWFSCLLQPLEGTFGLNPWSGATAAEDGPFARWDGQLKYVNTKAWRDGPTTELERQAPDLALPAGRVHLLVCRLQVPADRLSFTWSWYVNSARLIEPERGGPTAVWQAKASSPLIGLDGFSVRNRSAQKVRFEIDEIRYGSSAAAVTPHRPAP
jgi:predicted phosphodiesterase